MAESRYLRCFLRAGLFAGFVAIAGCGRAQRAYSGPELPATQVAEFRGFAVPCGEKLMLSDFDGEYEGSSLAAPGGHHRMRVTFITQPYYSTHAEYTPFELCTRRLRYDVSFDANPEALYYFAVDASPGGEFPLSVYETRERQPVDGRPIAADIRRVDNRESCGDYLSLPECQGRGPGWQ